MRREKLKRYEVYRALAVVQELARMEAQRISRENTRREREERRQSFSDDPSDMFAAMMQGEQLDVGLRLLADDVGRLTQFLDFKDADMMADVRELTDRFMQIAKRAAESVEDPDCPQALAWQRVFKLLRKVSTKCVPEALEQCEDEDEVAVEAVPEFEECGPLAFVMSSMGHASAGHRARLQKRMAKLRNQSKPTGKSKKERGKKNKKKKKK